MESTLTEKGPFKLEELIAYQKGAVVSREIIKTDGGTITVFAFDQNQGLSEHMTPFEALVLIIDGEAEITVSGVKNKLTKGESIHMPAGHPHSLKAFKPFKMILTMFK